MFGKPRDFDDTLDSSAIDGFFGDESAAETIVEVHELQQRVELVEAQVNSQFTSLATYAQIAQEQVELARSEAKAATERSEQRMTELIERERADRLAESSGVAPAELASSAVAASTDIEVSDRLDALDGAVDEIRAGLADCLQRQKELAEAITTMLDRLTPPPVTAPPLARPTCDDLDTMLAEAGVHDFDLAALAPPDPTTITGEVPLLAPPTIDVNAIPLSGPIAELSFDR